MTYDDFIEALQPIVSEAFEDGRNGVVYRADTLVVYEAQYPKLSGRTMSERDRMLITLVDRLMMDANQAGVKAAHR